METLSKDLNSFTKSTEENSKKSSPTNSSYDLSLSGKDSPQKEIDDSTKEDEKPKLNQTSSTINGFLKDFTDTSELYIQKLFNNSTIDDKMNDHFNTITGAKINFNALNSSAKSIEFNDEAKYSSPHSNAPFSSESLNGTKEFEEPTFNNISNDEDLSDIEPSNYLTNTHNGKYNDSLSSSIESSNSLSVDDACTPNPNSAIQLTNGAKPMEDEVSDSFRIPNEHNCCPSSQTGANIHEGVQHFVPTNIYSDISSDEFKPILSSENDELINSDIRINYNNSKKYVNSESKQNDIVYESISNPSSLHSKLSESTGVSIHDHEDTGSNELKRDQSESKGGSLNKNEESFESPNHQLFPRDGAIPSDIINESNKLILEIEEGCLKNGDTSASSIPEIKTADNDSNHKDKYTIDSLISNSVTDCTVEGKFEGSYVGEKLLVYNIEGKSEYNLSDIHDTRGTESLVPDVETNDIHISPSKSPVEVSSNNIDDESAYSSTHQSSTHQSSTHIESNNSCIIAELNSINISSNHETIVDDHSNNESEKNDINEVPTLVSQRDNKSLNQENIDVSTSDSSSTSNEKPPYDGQNNLEEQISKCSVENTLIYPSHINPTENVNGSSSTTLIDSREYAMGQEPCVNNSKRETGTTTVTDNIQASDSPSNTVSTQTDDQVESEKIMDIFGNGLLIKETIQTGSLSSERAQNGQIVTISYTCIVTETNTKFDDANNVKIVLGEGDVIIGIDIAVALMYLGEKCKLSVDPRYAYREYIWENKEKQILKKNTHLTYFIELHSIEHFPLLESVNYPFILSLCESKKDNGNNYFKHEDYTTAALIYQKAINHIDKIEQFKELTSTLKNNLACCLMMVKDHNQAIPLLQSIISDHPSNLKAIIRLIECFECTSQITESFEIIEKAKLIYPTNKTILNKETNLIQKHNHNKHKLGNMYKKMFSPSSTTADTVEIEKAIDSVRKKSTKYSWWRCCLLISTGVALTAVAFMSFYKKT